MEKPAVEKKVCEGLPDSQPVQHRVGHQSKPLEPKILSWKTEKKLRDFLESKHGGASDYDPLDGGREITADVEPISVAAREGTHFGRV